MNVVEKWVPISKVDGRYEISNLGRVKSVERKVKCGYSKLRSVKEVIRMVQVNNFGYEFISVKHKGKFSCIFVHKEVAIAFIGNPNSKPEVNHIDGDPRNNSISNLEWVTRSENMNHSYKKLGHKWAVRVYVGGENRRLIDVCEEKGLLTSLVRSRLYSGWSLDKALNTPKSKYSNEKV
jgi:hypothetical protein